MSVMCWSVRNVLDLFADDRLTPERRVKVAAHLQSCALCRAAAKEAAALTGLAEAPTPPPGLADAILELLEKEAPRPASAPAPRWRLSAAQAAAMAYLALAGAGNALPGPSTEGLKPPAVEAPR